MRYLTFMKHEREIIVGNVKRETLHLYKRQKKIANFQKMNNYIPAQPHKLFPLWPRNLAF